MLFNSLEFLLIFLPITFFLYFWLNKKHLTKIATAFLVFASLCFYSYWKIEYLPIILFSMIFNYLIGYALSKSLNPGLYKKTLLLFGISGNILLLCYYKYFDFLIANINSIFHQNFNYMHIIMPLAISFFTFQQIAYITDSYKGKTKEYDFLTYALFVTFFPQLIAGPIVHHTEMMPQFAKLRNRFINHKNISIGLFLLAIGLFKKVMIADYLSPVVCALFDSTHTLSFFESWIASLSYTLQLYFDFSGYCDMATGIGYLFNISLPQNFNSPYKADSIQDFWRRWHMTLSRFLKEYLYIPLGGNRLGQIKTYRNLFLTFLVGGLWHGANWTFVIWGGIHGIGICLHRFWKQFNFRINKIFAVIITFIFINCSWVYFRANCIHKANEILRSMFGMNGFEPVIIDKLRFSFNNGDIKLSLFLFIPAIISIFAFKNSFELSKRFKPNKIYALVVFFLLIISILEINKISEFLYFQF